MAISIPIFTAQLEKSREGVDAANIRSTYAEVVAEQISGGTNTSKKVTLKQQTAGWQNSFEFPANLVSGTGAAQPSGSGSQEVTITATDSGATIDLLLNKA